MTVLPDLDRAAVRQALAGKWSNEFASLALTKAELLAAVNGIDDYLHANGAVLNSAIPQPARSVLSKGQKAILLAQVAMQRYWSDL